MITNAVCASTFNFLPSTNICTSGAGGRSVCGGDSGGPLQYGGQLVSSLTSLLFTKLHLETPLRLAVRYPRVVLLLLMKDTSSNYKT